MLASWKGTSNKARQYIKKQKHHFTNQSPYSQSNGVSSSTDVSESWTIKKADHQRTDVFELGCREHSWESLGLQGDPTNPV